MGGPATQWRGAMLDQRSAAMMDEVVRLCPGIPVQPSQGSWSGASASAGTHSGAGAIDLEAASLAQLQRDQIVLAMRQVGWAAWHRTPSQGQWGHHIHGVAMGEAQLAPAAADQCADYMAGRNGLANNAPDDGPRDFDHVGITWEQYQARQGKAQEDEMKTWAVNVGDGWLITDMATYRNGVADYKVIEDGLALAAFTLFNAGKAVSPPWRDYILALPEVA